MYRFIRLGYVEFWSYPSAGGAEVYTTRLIQNLQGVKNYLWTTSADEKLLRNELEEHCDISLYPRSIPVDFEALPHLIQEIKSEIIESVVHWAARVSVDIVLLNSPIYYYIPELALRLRPYARVGFIQHNISGRSFELLLQSYATTSSWSKSLGSHRDDLLGLAKDQKGGIPGSPFTCEQDFTVYPSLWAKQFYDPFSQKPSFVLHPLLPLSCELPTNCLEPVDITVVNPNPLKGGLIFMALACFYLRGARFRILAGGWGNALESITPHLSPHATPLFTPRIPENIQVLGHVKNMSEIYRSTKLLLMPSRVESYGLIAAEAVMHSCVVVTSDLPGILEGVGDAAVIMPYFTPPHEWALAIGLITEGSINIGQALQSRSEYLLKRQAHELLEFHKFLSSMF